MALAVVRDLREHRAPASEDELADFETDVLAGFVLARASAGLTDSTIRNDTNHLELIRDWFGRSLWEMQPADADTYFGTVLRNAKPSTRTGRAAALTVSSSSCARSWSAAASSPRPRVTTPSPGWRPTSGFASTRRGCSTWTTCVGSWGGSAS